MCDQVVVFPQWLAAVVALAIAVALAFKVCQWWRASTHVASLEKFARDLRDRNKTL